MAKAPSILDEAPPIHLTITLPDAYYVAASVQPIGHPRRRVWCLLPTGRVWHGLLELPQRPRLAVRPECVL